MTAPIFILSHARTGSTLLRYIVDAHPQVCCPPELALGRLCRNLTYTLALTLGDESMGLGDEGPACEVRAAVRSHIDQIMNAYCASKQKVRWCDKSTNNVDHLGIIDGIFPDAQYVCLHRHGLDVVNSLLELFRHGFAGRYAEKVARSPDNLVDAMIDTWTEATQAVLDFEAAHPQRCFRVRYEDLVATPASIAEQMFSFLELPFPPKMLDAVFAVSHDRGPGDLRIQFTSEIQQNRVGRGARLPRAMISPDRLASLNRIHRVLGYAAVAGEAPSPIEKALTAANRISRAVKPGHWG